MHNIIIVNNKLKLRRKNFHDMLGKLLPHGQLEQALTQKFVAFENQSELPYIASWFFKVLEFHKINFMDRDGFVKFKSLVCIVTMSL